MADPVLSFIERFQQSQLVGMQFRLQNELTKRREDRYERQLANQAASLTERMRSNRAREEIMRGRAGGGAFRLPFGTDLSETFDAYLGKGTRRFGANYDKEHIRSAWNALATDFSRSEEGAMADEGTLRDIRSQFFRHVQGKGHEFDKSGTIEELSLTGVSAPQNLGGGIVGPPGPTSSIGAPVDTPVSAPAASRGPVFGAAPSGATDFAGDLLGRVRASVPRIDPQPIFRQAGSFLGTGPSAPATAGVRQPRDPLASGVGRIPSRTSLEADLLPVGAPSSTSVFADTGRSRIGELVEKGNKKWRITGFDEDGEPLVVPALN